LGSAGSESTLAVSVARLSGAAIAVRSQGCSVPVRTSPLASCITTLPERESITNVCDLKVEASELAAVVFGISFSGQ
jgi:hypothetical protein